DAYFGPSGDEFTFAMQGNRLHLTEFAGGSPPWYTTRTFDGEAFFQRQSIARDRLRGPSAIPVQPLGESFLKTHLNALEGRSFYLECLATTPYEGRGNYVSFHHALFLERAGLTESAEPRPYGLVAALRS